MLLSLEDLAFDILLKNFEILIANKTSNSVFSKTIPTLISEKILHGLNDCFLGVPPNSLRHFKRRNFMLANIRVNGRRIRTISKMLFLRGHELLSAKLENFYNIRVESWIKHLKVSNLRELSLEGCCFLDRSVVVDQNQSENEENENEIMKKLNSILPTYEILDFSCLKILNVGCSDINDIQFDHLTKNCSNLSELNISSTNITNLRLLERFPRLEMLDCSFPKCKSVYDTYLALLKLKSLKTLDISKSDNIGYGLLVLRYMSAEEEMKIHSAPETDATDNLSQETLLVGTFLEKANWENMTHFNFSGNWSRPITSLA